MTGARMNTLASLRGRIERIEAPAMRMRFTGWRSAMPRPMRRCAAASRAPRCMKCSPRDVRVRRRRGFIAGLAGRVTSRRPLVWVRQDFSEIESGALSMSGLAELGLDPRLLVTVRAADVDAALRTAADALACDALGAVVLEVWGEPRQLDLVASRKLTLAAQASGVTGLAAAARGDAAALDRGDQMDRARGAFAALSSLACVGRAGVRRRARS